MKKINNNVVNEQIANWLKAIGVTDETTGLECTVEALKKVDYNDPSSVATVRKQIEKAFQRQMSAEVSSTRRSLQDEIEHDFVTTDKLLASEDLLWDPTTGQGAALSLPEQAACQNLLNIISGRDAILTDDKGNPIGVEHNEPDMDIALASIMTSLVAGLPEQDLMNKNQAGEATKVAEFAMQVIAYNCPDPDPDKVGEYLQDQRTNDIMAILTKQLGSPKAARMLLMQPLNPNSALLRNPALMAKYDVVRENRNANDKEPVRLIDLFVSMSESVSRAQTYVFCENRGEEQSKGVGNPYAPTQLGNAMGKNGTALIEDTIGKNLTPQAKPAKASNKSKPKIDKIWRGFYKLEQKIEAMMKELFSTMQMTGFLERINGRNKREATPVENDGYLAWDTEYQPMPAEFAAHAEVEEFYDGAKARILADKVRASACNADLMILLQGAKLSQDDLNKYVQESLRPRKPGEPAFVPDPKFEPAAELVQKQMYFEQRVAMGQMTITNLQQKMHFDPSFTPDNAYLQKKDQEILMLTGVAGSSELLDKYCVWQECDAAAMRTQKEEMQEALTIFKNYNDPAADPLKRFKSHAMLADMFDIRNKYDQGAVTDRDLDDLMSNVNGGPFNPNKVDEMLNGLRKNPTDKDYLSPKHCREQLHIASEKYLQNIKYAEAYHGYDVATTTIDNIAQRQN